MNGFNLSATDLKWQEARRVGDFFRKVNLEMAQNFPAGVAPTAYGGKSHVLEQFAALVEDFIDWLTAPGFKSADIHKDYLPVQASIPLCADSRCHPIRYRLDTGRRPREEFVP